MSVETEEPQRYVIHLPIVAADLPSLLRLARSLCRSLSFVPEIDGGAAEVSLEDDQTVRQLVFCDQLRPDSRIRCALAAGHAGECQ